VCEICKIIVLVFVFLFLETFIFYFKPSCNKTGGADVHLVAGLERTPKPERFISIS
jgi:hypothetical protein